MINKTAIVYDRGERLSLASKLGEKLKKVWYYRPESSSYPMSLQDQIGRGLETVEKINNFLSYIDKADYLIYFDVYDGEDQDFYRQKGYTVFGGGLSSKLELDKILFLDILEKYDLPIPETYLAKGMDPMMTYLEGKKDKFIKSVRYRGDFETYHFINMKRAESWFNDLRDKVGRNSKTIEALIQELVKSACEPGYDGFNINGACPNNSLVGYEDKDKLILSRVFPETPEVLASINDALAPFFKGKGMRGHWTIESRITDEGVVYPLDPTIRSPSPSGELMCEIYDNYTEAVLEIAEGKVPELEPNAEYAAEIILKSQWHKEHELCVEFPKEIERWVKLKNYTVRNGTHYCIPNGGQEFFGAVIGLGKTPEEAKKKAIEHAEQIGADELQFDCDFSKVEEGIKEGKKFGIDF
jgi:hypothetical protein